MHFLHFELFCIVQTILFYLHELLEFLNGTSLDIAYLLWSFSFTGKLGEASFPCDFQSYHGELFVASV